MQRLLLSIIGFALVLGCPASGAQEFDGIWRSRGYGVVFELNGTRATVYDETAISFFPVATATVAGDVARLDGDPGADPFFLERDGDRLVVRTEATTILFDRLDALPAVRGGEPTPLNVFDVFWQTIFEHFPSFEILGVDWNELRGIWRPQVSNGMSANALQDLLAEMARPLMDGHTTIHNPATGRFINTGPRPSPLGDALAPAVEANVEREYIDNGRFSRVAGDDRFRYGTTGAGRFGYIAIRDYENRPVEFAASLDQILDELEHTDALLLDLRSNAGGNNRHALTLGSRLTDTVRLAYRQQARNGGPETFTAPNPVFVKPRNKGYRERPVYLLTNDGTASAGDVQALILSALPWVTQVGEATRGMFSQLTKGLPNGWIMTTSNERFLSPDGRNYEVLGIAPELTVVNTREALEAGDDLIIDAAIADYDKRLPIEATRVPVGPAMSGSWYAPDHDGEGFLLEVLDDARAVIYWFTYAPAGGVQAWLVAVGEIDGNRIHFGEVLAPRGARFGDAFAPDDVILAPWGELTLRFTSCNRAVATYHGPDEFGANFKSLQRLTGHVGIGCDGADARIPNRVSGSWYDPGRSGEGWILGHIDEARVLAVWFTFGLDAEPLWLIGIGQIAGDAIVVESLSQPVGGRFGPAFRPEDVERLHWGNARIESLDCATIEITWEPVDDAFAAGTRRLSRLSNPAGLGCVN